MTDTPRFYAACLASYNNGRLYGAWIDSSSDADKMADDIAKMLRGSPCPNVLVSCPLCEGDRTTTYHNSETGETRVGACVECNGTGQVPSAEEYAIHDYDGLPTSFGEYPLLADIAAFMELVEKHEDDFSADDIAEIVSNFGSVKYAADMLEDHFRGIYNTFRDFADEQADEMLEAHGITDDSPASRYFDYAAFARDLAFDVSTVDVEKGVAVFWN